MRTPYPPHHHALQQHVLNGAFVRVRWEQIGATVVGLFCLVGFEPVLEDLSEDDRRADDVLSRLTTAQRLKTKGQAAVLGVRRGEIPVVFPWDSAWIEGLGCGGDGGWAPQRPGEIQYAGPWPFW